jgi:hypothetical protein
MRALALGVRARSVDCRTRFRVLARKLLQAH